MLCFFPLFLFFFFSLLFQFSVFFLLFLFRFFTFLFYFIIFNSIVFFNLLLLFKKHCVLLFVHKSQKWSEFESHKMFLFFKFCSRVKNRLRISKNVHVSKLMKGFPNFQEMIIFLKKLFAFTKRKIEILFTLLKKCSHVQKSVHNWKIYSEF